MNVEAISSQQKYYDENETKEYDIDCSQQLTVDTGLKDGLYNRLKHEADILFSTVVLLISSWKTVR